MEIYRVGGSVRDELLGLTVTEKDWAVVGASRERMLSRGFKPVGKHFPVFIHPDSGEEYALARTERKTGRGYHGFAFDAAPAVTIEQDLARRDLTINAMARAEDGRLVDPYGGRGDLESRTLRHVSPAFAEDPVRILRTARFAAKLHDLGFAVAGETMALMREMVRDGEADALVAERVWQETEKALTTPHPSVFFDVLRSADALARVLPEIHALANDDRRALRTLDAAATHHPPEILLALLADFARRRGQSLMPLCKRLRLPNRHRRLMAAAEHWLEPLSRAEALPREDLLDLLESAGATHGRRRLDSLLSVCSLGRGAPSPRGVARIQRALHALADADLRAALADAAEKDDVKRRVRELKLAALTDI